MQIRAQQQVQTHTQYCKYQPRRAAASVAHEADGAGAVDDEGAVQVAISPKVPRVSHTAQQPDLKPMTTWCKILDNIPTTPEGIGGTYQRCARRNKTQITSSARTCGGFVAMAG
ncbi:hypothetical protein VOLCADRAFT_88266 [Volvox carteri f. nagariensis]|uniref:Uncharacterized protein n=1 Tax=Volvox carteri f. nagariensis TaxID=3068 RepID=D8TNQ8_VOLCA|nr:uncharacterized protein VOLCADRAFT_88266 [Volvox carteri f. nagariensis]EFJ50882.1 hypothetical protein VOLCADRAFT_88266 [Volvox carteri f. nagariensis]|eukprot:XP_002947894.1 hypothetical protein VOLCADRAFT_88266 [Volvox carteri f. nagariensis]